MTMLRPALLVAAVIVICGVGGFETAVWAAQAGQGKVIKVVARRFRFEPGEIVLKRGETVTLEIETEDVLMGFDAPDLAVRTDIVPGVVSRVTFTPQRTGTFTFLCDIFCGSGHENMNGVIKVVD